jgi:hypothetical protein
MRLAAPRQSPRTTPRCLALQVAFSGSNFKDRATAVAPERCPLEPLAGSRFVPGQVSVYGGTPWTGPRPADRSEFRFQVRACSLFFPSWKALFNKEQINPKRQTAGPPKGTHRNWTSLGMFPARGRVGACERESLKWALAGACELEARGPRYE